MRIVVSRSGGLAGLVRRGEVDTDARQDAEAWLSLADRAAPLPQAPAQDATRDGFWWTIELGDQRAVLPDGSLTGPLRVLAERTLAEGGPGR